MKRVTPKCPIQILVEGNDQRNFFEALTQHLSLSGVQVQNFGGVDELRGFLGAFVNASGFRGTVQSIGIVRDAESSDVSAFQSVLGSLDNAGLPRPTSPGERVGANPAVTVMILQGADGKGMLETLLCKTFEDSPVDGCIDGFFTCVEALPGSARRSPKARARAYLTTKIRPELSVGVAAKRGYWDLDHDALGGVRGFLTSL